MLTSESKNVGSKQISTKIEAIRPNHRTSDQREVAFNTCVYGAPPW